MQRSNQTTSRYLEDAGICKGMRILELGCGNGEVSEILAQLVGEEGFVLALDNNSQILSKAQATLSQYSSEHVSFVTHDITKSVEPLHKLAYPPFDAIVCRRVLMYLANPEDVIAELARLLKPKGLVVAEEADLTMVPTSTSLLPAHELASAWLEQMLRTENVNLRMGFDLPKVFTAAGFAVQGIRANAVIEGQGQQYTLAEMMHLLKTRLQESGIARPEQVDTLAAQLQAEANTSDFVYISGMSFCAWGTLLD